ncbi:NUDIX domain-containing protein [Puniceicoccus vermicola]|uniref:NUDIX domain-containing protein n=1 Tax=Puniceicoccus vermicola TaxID=388746 RepID=A0A7X1E3W0_9BACT|nr:NUDIX domain-containing protein [Puniceicoccus vermicola]MBC2601399.1 NUDIX domain-containing protein [Puniceicoccus vermicola]
MKWIRHACRAVIVRRNRLLAIKMCDRSGVFYVLPGGGQRHGETMKEGLKRECLEEINLEVIIGPLLYVREYIGRNHNFSKYHRDFHQVETVFSCSIAEGAEPEPGSETDRKQIGIEWLDLKQLASVRFLPADAVPVIQRQMEEGSDLYLGDIN